MRGRPKKVNVPLKAKENESVCSEGKEEAVCTDLSKGHKICKVTKSKVIKAFKKEKGSDLNQAQLQECTLRHSTGLGKELCHNKEEDGSCQYTWSFSDTPTRDVVIEPPLPLNSKENLSQSRPVSLGGECYFTPNRNKAEKSDCGTPEKREKSVGFAAVTTGEFGITQESFTTPSLGKSPTPLKFRRRSTIGVRGSPENNALIQYLAQQRSNRKKATQVRQVSPLKYKPARSMKDKIDAFQASFKSVQEVEAETGSSGLSQVNAASQGTGSSQNKVCFTEEQNLDQCSEKFMSGDNGADLKENPRQNLTSSSKPDTEILSSCQDASVTEPAAAVSKERVYEQHNPIESLETVITKDVLETGHDSSCEHITKDVTSNVMSDLSRREVSFAEEPSLGMCDESKAAVTPQHLGRGSLPEHRESGSLLRSVLKKMLTKEYLSGIDRGGGESLAVSSCAETFEAVQTVYFITETWSSKKLRKRVTFGRVLSPEIFDEALPANTPVRKGATPVRHPGLQSNRPSARPSLLEEPFPQLNFDCSNECVEPLQESLEGSFAAEDLLPVETAEAESDKPDMTETPSSAKRKCSTISEETDFSISKATSNLNAKDTQNPGKNKVQRQRNVTTSAAKKTQKVKHTGYGKRRRKKVNKSLYGEREMASKKPLLSPIPEIPELFSASSSNSTKAIAFFSEDVLLEDTKSGNAGKDVQQKLVAEEIGGKTTCVIHTFSGSEDLDAGEASSPSDTVFQVPEGDLEPVSGNEQEFSNMPDAKCAFDTSDHFQQGEETACVKKAKESGFLIENWKLRENLLNEAEQLTGLELLNQQDMSEHADAQRTQCPQKDSTRSGPSRGRRRRSSSAMCFLPMGNSLPFASYNVEEIFSAPHLEKQKSDNSGGMRVRRSMRLHKGAETEGLAWIEVPCEIQKNPPLVASACKTRRRTISTSTFTESEKLHHKRQNLLQFSASGKNNDSVNLDDGPSKRWRRKSMCELTAQETRTYSPTRRRSRRHSVYRKDRSNQNHYDELEIPLENNI
ncbi:cell division cycle-associated protein 2 [Neopsephotus bourkii]|uniref:cell division cycle-associated protein 2 n=1 Tax=Neopsephotus bourkii TaxID=309878 RepID=UPI002AA59244|nr:cell division cycle-associated protein 2 [Neopsephotus bourkii]